MSKDPSEIGPQFSGLPVTGIFYARVINEIANPNTEPNGMIFVLMGHKAIAFDNKIYVLSRRLAPSAALNRVRGCELPIQPGEIRVRFTIGWAGIYRPADAETAELAKQELGLMMD